MKGTAVMPGRHSYRYRPRQWTLSDVLTVRRARAEWIGDEQGPVEYTLIYPSSEVKLHHIDQLKAHWQKHGRPLGFPTRRWSSGGREAIFDAADPPATVIEAQSREVDPTIFIKDLAFTLDLTDQRVAPSRSLQSAFAAVRFNVQGQSLANDLIKMLAAVEISAETAEDFQGKEIPDKIKELIQAKDIFFAIVVPQDDKAWIVSEAVYASEQGKPIIIAEQDDANFQPGILGQDRESIRFRDGPFSNAYLPILQGVQHLRRETGEDR
jgi:hypothetical protein